MKFRTYSAMRIDYIHQNYLQGIKYAKKGETVTLPEGSLITSIEFDPELLTVVPAPIERNSNNPFSIGACTFPQHWQAGRRHAQSLEDIVGNLEDLDINATSPL